MSSIPNPLVKTTTTSLEDRFQELAARWEQATAHLSSTTRREASPAYQEIIALGEPIVPLLLRDLELTNRHWFAALSAITRDNPIPSEDAGHVERMVAAWLRWGREKGYRT